VLTVERQGVLTPQPAEHLDRLNHAVDPHAWAVVSDTGRRVVLGHPAGTDADFESTIAE